MKLDSFNILRLNKQEKLPQFVGIEYNFSDDEFAEIEEDDHNINNMNNQNIKNMNNQNISNTSKVTPNSSQAPSKPVNDTEYGKILYFNNSVEHSKKKKLDDLFDLLNSETPNHTENNLPILNTQTTVTNFQHMDNFTPDNNANANSNVALQNKEMDEDEFVDIEEDTKKNEDFAYIYSKPENKFNENPTEKIPDISLQYQSVNLSKINNEADIEKKSEIDFQNLIFLNPKPKNILTEIEINSQKNIINDTNPNNLNLKSTENLKNNKMSLDDLLGDLDNANNTNNERNINFLNDPNNLNDKPQEPQNPNTKSNIEDLEFCEVEEEQAKDNIIEKNKENHSEYENSIFISPVPNENIVSVNNIESKIDFVLENVEEKNVNSTVSKVSIINYTPDDFLDEFKRENKITKNDDEFQFVVNLFLFRKKRKKMILKLKKTIMNITIVLAYLKILFRINLKNLHL